VSNVDDENFEFSEDEEIHIDDGAGDGGGQAEEEPAEQAEPAEEAAHTGLSDDDISSAEEMAEYADEQAEIAKAEEEHVAEESGMDLGAFGGAEAAEFAAAAEEGRQGEGEGEGEEIAIEAPEEAEGEGEEGEEEEEEEDEGELVRKRKKLFLIVEIAGLAIVCIGMLAGTYFGIAECQADRAFWGVLNAYVLSLVFIAYTLWKARETETPYRVMLAISLSAILTALFCLFLELKTYDYDINAETAKQHARLERPVQSGPPTMTVAA